MKKSFHFSVSEKIKFYITYLYFKLFLFLDIKKGIGSIYWAELLWTLRVLFRSYSTLNAKSPWFASEYDTKFGSFSIDPNLMAVVIVSPAFERQDIDYLLTLVQKDLNAKKQVLFIDVGAYFGKYTVLVGNAFRQKKNLKIMAFEPSSEAYSMRGYDLLSENIKRNFIKNVTTYNVGLGSKNRIFRKNGISTKRLDSILPKKNLKQFDVIYMKLDIDGYETDALQGSTNFLNETPKIVLLIEDFVNPRNVAYLEKKGFQFIIKKTPYNSFWIKENNR